MKREEIVAAARHLVLIKTPYRHAGRSEVGGVDCVGVPMLIARRIGYPYVDVPLNYSRKPDGRLLEHLRAHLDEVGKDDQRAGNIGVFWFDRHTREAQHVAVFTGEGTIIHAYEKVKTVVEMPMERLWIRSLITVFAVRGVE